MDDGIAASARLIGEIRGGAFAGPATRRRRPIVLVVGTEDSGASLCSRVLSVLGVQMADRATDERGVGRLRPNGPADHHAASKLAALHGRLLDLFDGGELTGGEDAELPVSWWADPRVTKVRRELADLVKDGISAGQLGFYDRRLMRLMPVWNQIARELKLAPIIIHCLRNPAQLARVLHARDGIAPGLAEYRWFANTLEFFRHARAADICTIEYDEWFVDSAANLQKLRRLLAFPDEPAALDVEETVSAIVEQERPGSDIGSGEAQQPLIRSVYRLARRVEHDAGARDQLRHIAGQLLSFQQLHAADRSGTLSTKARRTSVRDAPSFVHCLSPASFWQPEDVLASAWHEHAPFAFWLVEALRPRNFVELGTHHGFSYLAFCQAVQRLGGITKCYAVDTWKGDEHAGFYGEDVFARLSEIHERRYSGFSRLIRSTFDEALPHFGDGTIDLLHIDGRHRYDDVVHDFESWLPKLSDRAVVLLHDINVRERGFGVWQFWAELQTRYRCFEFVHGHGLGVVQVGRLVAEPLRPLLESTAKDKATVAQIYAHLGRFTTASQELSETRLALQEREARIAILERDVAAIRNSLADAESWSRDREATIELLRAEIDSLREALRNTESWARDREATIEVMRMEVARLQEAAAAARIREEELQRVREQLAGLTEAVTHAERDAEERRAAEAAIRREIAAAGEAARRRSEAAAQDGAALKLAEGRASEAERAAEAAESRASEAERAAEAAEFRASEAERAAEAAERRVGDAERRAAALGILERRVRDAEREAAVLTGEVAALHRELAGSREVGRATLEALAASNSSPVHREPRLGWRQAVRRLFGTIRQR